MKKLQFISIVFNVIVLIDVTISTEPLPGPFVVASKGKVWPKPWQQIYPGGYFLFNPDNFQFQLSKEGYNCSLLQNALDRYKKIIQDEHKGRATNLFNENLKDNNYLGNLNNITVTLTGLCNDGDYPNLQSNEQYNLTIAFNNAELKSTSIWGILRGLETFSQLIYLEATDISSRLRIDATKIEDHPRFKHRGLLLDTARHYEPLKQIYEILDGLAYNKLNVFHWHITDDQSFPYVSKKFPELSEKGAYSQRHIYTIEDIENIIEYARVRGIRVIPEFDTPGHTRSWGLSHPELICQYHDNYGPMDPSKNSTYEFIAELFTEIRRVFKDEYIHLGGDEVDFSCWLANPAITKFMSNMGLYVTSEYINYYGQKVINSATALNFSTIVWEEMFFDGVQLSNKAVVQIWKDWMGQRWTDHMNRITAAGKKAILSACWYLDQLTRTWQDFYNCDPLQFGGTDDQIELIMGGEACMWGEMANEHNIVSRIFPRASATAEKLWSERSTNFVLDEQAQRLEEHACRMNRRGVSASPPNGPGFCD